MQGDAKKDSVRCLHIVNETNSLSPLLELEWFKIAQVCKHAQMINFLSAMVIFCNQSMDHMRAKPWGLVRTDHGSTTIL